MPFLDRFRPEWKNSSAEVRAEAVRRLGADQVEILKAIAREDADASVRRIAMKRLDDPETLAELAHTDPDGGLKRYAAERAMSLLVAIATATAEAEATAALAKLEDEGALTEVAKIGALDGVRRAALERLKDPKHLIDVAKHAREASVRLVALGQVTAPSVLRALAQSDEDDDVAMAALERIDDVEALEALASRSHRKSVRRRATERLAALKLDHHLPVPKQRRHDQLELVAAAEALVADWDAARASERFDELLERWKDLGKDAEEDYRERLDRAATTVYMRRGTIDAAKAAEIEKRRELQAQLTRREDLCRQVEALQAEAVPREIEALRAAWSGLGAVSEPALAAVDKRYTRAVEEAERRHQRGLEAEKLGLDRAALCAEAEALGAGTDLVEAKKAIEALKPRWAELRGDDDRELRERFHAAFERVRGRERELDAEERKNAQERERQAVARLETLATRLEGLVEIKDLRALDRELREAQAGQKDLDQVHTRDQRREIQGRLDAVFKLLRERLSELREAEDWNRWANLPVRDELCKRAEALLAETDVKEVAKKLKALRQEWDEVGPVPREHSQAMWERFKKAADELHTRCEVYFKQLDDERAANLQKKIDLCVKAETLAASEDFKSTAEELKKLQAEWKTIGPIPKAEADAVWNRFRSACDPFFARRKEHLDVLHAERAEALRERQELTTRAEALAQSTDWDVTADELKKLQADWKNLAPAPRPLTEETWQRFRRACDTFFERRSKRFDIARAEAIAKMESLVRGVESLLPPELRPKEPLPSLAPVPEPVPQASPVVVDTAQPVAMPVSELAASETGEPAPAQTVEAVAASPEPVAAEPEPVAEVIVAAPEPAPPAPPAEVAFTPPESAVIAQTVIEARASWKGLSGAPLPLVLAFEQRFTRACYAAVETYPEVFAATELDPKHAAKKREALCKRVEDLAGRDEVATPEGESVAKMAERLKKALVANAFKKEGAGAPIDWKARGEELRELRAQWDRLPPVPGDAGRELLGRFRRAVDRFYERRGRGTGPRS